MASYRVVIMYVYHTCVLRCGYCNLAEQGHVLDTSVLQRYKDPAFIDQITGYFNKRTTTDDKWLILLTGGDPLMMPNFDRFCDNLFAHGNRVGVYTSLAFKSTHRWFRYLLTRQAPEFDYLTTSFHPESEEEIDDYFQRVELLKKAGHSVFVRMVGHPKRLARLPELAERCRKLDVGFFPTVMFGPDHPWSYTEEERNLLRQHFTSYTQIVQLQGGLDTTITRCQAGSRYLAVYMENGNLLPCISVKGPVLGNIYEDRLTLYDKAIACPEAPAPCICDVHMQQDIVEGSDDRASLEAAKRGFVNPLSFEAQDELVRRKGLPMASSTGRWEKLIGNVASNDQLFFDRAMVREQHIKAYGKRRPLPMAAAPAEAPAASLRPGLMRKLWRALVS
jgi:organic radical activating enzyme